MIFNVNSCKKLQLGQRHEELGKGHRVVCACPARRRESGLLWLWSLGQQKEDIIDISILHSMKFQGGGFTQNTFYLFSLEVGSPNRSPDISDS